MTLQFMAMEASDDEMVHKWRTSEHVKKWMFTTVSDDLEKHREWSEMVRTANDCAYFVAYAKLMDGSLMPIGLAYFTDISNYKCQVGFYIGEESVLENGFGKAILEWMTDTAFRSLGVHWVSGRIKMMNKASERLFTSCGYREDPLRILSRIFDIHRDQYLERASR
jgi:RimJ/RimL family protein N-acetyltransferase